MHVSIKKWTENNFILFKWVLNVAFIFYSFSTPAIRESQCSFTYFLLTSNFLLIVILHRNQNDHNIYFVFNFYIAIGMYSFNFYYFHLLATIDNATLNTLHSNPIYWLFNWIVFISHIFQLSSLLLMYFIFM